MFNLNDAFKELRKKGLIARQDYWCCQSCGGYAIGQMIEIRNRMGKKTTGYVFFHHQDTERAERDRILYLAYGNPFSGSADTPEATAKVGKTIVETLERHGFLTEWNGSPDTRILVKV